MVHGVRDSLLQVGWEAQSFVIVFDVVCAKLFAGTSTHWDKAFGS